MRKSAIITGVTGQDGAYLSKLLLEKGYQVIGTTRNLSTANLFGLKYLGIKDKVELIECDLQSIADVRKLILDYNPTEIYNLSAQSSVGNSFGTPIETFQYNTISIFNILENVKSINKSIKVYQASSSEMFGSIEQLPITEDSHFHPKSPYAISKASAHWICVNYKESHGLFVSCGVLFNHESFLRSGNFFVKKVIRDSILIHKELKDKLLVGNINIMRDFGYAPKYVEAMYLMLQQEKPDNYLVCSGMSISLKSIIEYVFEKLSIPMIKMEICNDLYRPAEIDNIYGSSIKTKSELNWEYELNFYEVLDILIKEELASMK